MMQPICIVTGACCLKRSFIMCSVNCIFFLSKVEIAIVFWKISKILTVAPVSSTVYLT